MSRFLYLLLLVPGSIRESYFVRYPRQARWVEDRVGGWEPTGETVVLDAIYPEED